MFDVLCFVVDMLSFYMFCFWYVLYIDVFLYFKMFCILICFVFWYFLYIDMFCILICFVYWYVLYFDRFCLNMFGWDMFGWDMFRNEMFCMCSVFYVSLLYQSSQSDICINFYFRICKLKFTLSSSEVLCFKLFIILNWRMVYCVQCTVNSLLTIIETWRTNN